MCDAIPYVSIKECMFTYVMRTWDVGLELGNMGEYVSNIGQHRTMIHNSSTQALAAAYLATGCWGCLEKGK